MAKEKQIRVNRDGVEMVHISGEVRRDTYEALKAYRWEHQLESLSEAIREWLEGFQSEFRT